MMPELVQDAIVTLAAAGAAWVVIRRVFTTVSPSGPKCASCPSASAKPRPAALADEPKPLTFFRTS